MEESKEIAIMKKQGLMTHDIARDFIKCHIFRITGAWQFPTGLDPPQNGEMGTSQSHVAISIGSIRSIPLSIASSCTVFIGGC